MRLLRPLAARTSLWAALLIGLSGPLGGMMVGPARGQSPPPRAKAQGKAEKPTDKPALPPLSPADARAVLDAFRQIADALDREERDARSHRTEVKRPERSVTPPTLTPAELDEQIRRLAGDGVEPAPLTSDDAFLRRLTLDVAGRLPTEAERSAFLAEKSPDKRARAIDLLLASEDYARHWARYWTDVVRYKATFEQPFLVNYSSLENWLFDQLKANTPWDEIATQLISGTGRTDDAGQTVLAVAHLDGRNSVSAPEFAGEVARIFLGIQIQCAQCHDHPTDPWTREQFHQFAAFFAGTQGRRLGRPGDPDYGIEVVSPDRVPRYGMPDLEDPSQVIPISPGFFLAQDSSLDSNGLAGLTSAERRTLAASLVTGQDNPWFARAFVNRLWYELIGDAFILPIDDLGPTREPVAAEVLDLVASQWQKGGYDIRWLFRTILNTQTYQREARSSQTATSAPAFTSNCPGPLRPDELAASLAQALDLPDGFMETPLNLLARRMARPGAQANSMNPPPALANLPANARRRIQPTPARMVDQLFGVDPSTPDDEIRGTIPQALFLMNSPFLQQALTRPGGPVDRILRDHPDNRKAIDAAYLKVLARSPTDEEARVALSYLTSIDDRRQALEDLLWALLNTSEFLSRH